MSDFALIKEMVKEVTAAIKKNLLIDWFEKPDARAAVMLTVRRTLARKGVQQGLQEILNEILEQAEMRYGVWYGGGGVKDASALALRSAMNMLNATIAHREDQKWQNGAGSHGFSGLYEC